MKIWVYFYLFLFSFITTLVLTYLVKRISLRLGIVDSPGERKLHTKSVPLLGGVSVVIGFTLGIVLNLCILFILPKDILYQLLPGVFYQIERVKLLLPKIFAILAGGVCMMLVGLIDDIRKSQKGLSYKAKLLLQFIISTFVVLVGIKITFLSSWLFNVIVSILWIVLIVNSFNLLDNMDGLCCGVGLISSLILAILVLCQGQHFTGFMLLVFAGALAGFLVWNFYPARIFLGDAGSLFIGFILACLSVVASYITPDTFTLFPVIMPVLILSVPLFDTFSVIYIRMREGRSIFVGDMSHFSHRLMRTGLNHRQVVLFIYLVSVGIGISSTLLLQVSNIGGIIILTQAIIIFILIGILMAIQNNKLQNK